MLIRTATSSASARPCRTNPTPRRLEHAVRSALAVAGAAALLAGCGGGGTTTTSASTPASTPSSSTPSSTAATQPATVLPRDVVNAPIKIASTTAGPVGYREVGTGSPVLLITGLSASMDDWQPDFVAGLAAAGHTVVVFDNAGVGQTAALPSPLTITAMADQTSALISALRLGRPAVLGWSMGGMIAQALTVLHPAQVSKLILAATQPGTGDALPVPAAAAAALVSGNPAEVLSVLFPPSAAAAAQAYAIGILRYPGFYQASSAIVADQTVAVRQWIAGGDPAGRRLGQIKIPTLVADGTLDRFNPVANDRMLVAAVPGATLILYPGAGHAFLFQDSASFLPSVERFLGAS
ncbi:MAG TPA: alpha/beta hydrolase [Streptosporangiaceae bacterium]|nr:alpha/beta hydrolase [Streptosporangiaceae bacterium]